jgi:hypothetical protein
VNAAHGNDENLADIPVSRLDNLSGIHISVAQVPFHVEIRLWIGLSNVRNA